MSLLFEEHQRQALLKLIHSIRNQDVKLARKCIDDGANIKYTDEWGDTLLHQCAVYNQPEIAKELVFHRADANLQNNMGMTPLMVVSNKL